MKAAIIVAHPDDEIIWAGGLILQHPQWDWTVLSLCRGDDSDRAPKFRSVCARLGLRGLISDLDDSDPLKAVDVGREIGGRIADRLAADRWDLCVTHGANGEYAHQRHMEVHAEVLRLIDEGTLKSRELWTFAYEPDPGGFCRPDPHAGVRINLTEGQFLEKTRIIQADYGYCKSSFEIRSCNSCEAFDCRAEAQKKEFQ